MSTPFKNYLEKSKKNKEIKERLHKIKLSSDKIYTESLLNLKGEVRILSNL